MAKSIILIPSRLGATRLPNKPLLKINNKSIIMHVYEKAIECGIGDVFVTTCDEEIISEVKKNGGKSILTSKDHNTGTDRIAEALDKIKLENEVDYIINLQGDEPLIDISDVKNLNFQTVNNNSDLATLACKIDASRQDKYSNSNIVKVVTQEDLQKKSISKAVKFERIIDAKKNNYIYQHIGIYIYKKSILKKFVKLNQTENEKVKKLEQLRALENGINIDVAYANTIPIGVDTKEDYVELKNLMEYKK